MQGLSSFNLLADKACCPICREASKPATCAFVGCAWMYDGCKLGSDGQPECCHSDWQASSYQLVCNDALTSSPSSFATVRSMLHARGHRVCLDAQVASACMHACRASWLLTVYFVGPLPTTQTRGMNQHLVHLVMSHTSTCSLHTQQQASSCRLLTIMCLADSIARWLPQVQGAGQHSRLGVSGDLST